MAWGGGVYRLGGAGGEGVPGDLLGLLRGGFPSGGDVLVAVVRTAIRHCLTVAGVGERVLGQLRVVVGPVLVFRVERVRFRGRDPVRDELPDHDAPGHGDGGILYRCGVAGGFTRLDRRRVGADRCVYE